VAVVARDLMDNVSPPATAAFTVATTPPTATITIAPGNAADHTVTATVALSEPGTFTCAVDGAPVACAAPSFQFVPVAEGTHTVTITARDALGNTGDSAADFVADWTAPVVAPVDDIEVPAGAGGDTDRQRPGAVVDFDVTATDNLDAAPTVTCDPASGSFFPLGATSVTCTAADASGNPSDPVTFQVTVVPPPPDAADVDVAYDPTDDALAFTETHGGDIAFPTRRTIVATAAGHSTRASTRRTHSVGDQGDLDAAMRFAWLRYDDGPRLRPTTNGYGYRSSERRDGSLKRVVIVARAGRKMVVVRYSAGADQSSIRYLRSGRTLRVVRVDGLAIPHLRTEAGSVVIDLAGGG
jgi:HYR domain-containing protein